MAVSGTWNLKYSWGCAGGYGSDTMTFNAGGTFSTTGGLSGKWSQTNGNIVWRFDQPQNAVYGGVVNGGAMVGNMSTLAGSAGCFYAITQSGAPQAEALEAAAEPGLDASGASPKKK